MQMEPDSNLVLARGRAWIHDLFLCRGVCCGNTVGELGVHAITIMENEEIHHGMPCFTVIEGHAVHNQLVRSTDWNHNTIKVQVYDPNYYPQFTYTILSLSRISRPRTIAFDGPDNWWMTHNYKAPV